MRGVQDAAVPRRARRVYRDRRMTEPLDLMTELHIREAIRLDTPIPRRLLERLVATMDQQRMEIKRLTGKLDSHLKVR